MGQHPEAVKDYRETAHALKAAAVIVFFVFGIVISHNKILFSVKAFCNLRSPFTVMEGIVTEYKADIILAYSEIPVINKHHVHVLCAKEGTILKFYDFIVTEMKSGDKEGVRHNITSSIHACAAEAACSFSDDFVVICDAVGKKYSLSKGSSLFQ